MALASLTATVVTLLGAFAGGGLFTAMWRTIFGKGGRKLAEAETLSRISASIRQEIRKENNDLRDRMDKIVDAICGLTDMLDELFPKITGLTDLERQSLRRSINLAKRAT